MLILARRPGERVVIDGEILVTVMEVSGNTVRLGIEAPQGISIYREEIWLAVEEENRAAAAAAADALPTGPVGEIPIPAGDEHMLPSGSAGEIPSAGADVDIAGADVDVSLSDSTGNAQGATET